MRPRLIIKSCRKQVFLRRLQDTNDLDNNFFIPNRAKLILDFLKSHGDRMVKEKNGPKRSFPVHSHSYNMLCPDIRSDLQLRCKSPLMTGGCVCVHPDSKLRVLGRLKMQCRF